MKKKWLLLLVPVLFLTSFIFSSQKVDAQELTNVITSVKLYDIGNGREVSKDASGTYLLTQNVTYRFDTAFDLSKYNGQLQDGDTFTFTIPAPATVKDGTSIPLIDKATNVEVGTAVVSSNGDSQGGVVTVTLKNLAAYLKATGADQVRDVKGNFFVDFLSSKLVTNETWTYLSTETNTTITNKITVSERKANDYSAAIGIENYAKIGGVLTKRSYNSAELGKSGDYVHPWNVRLNARQATYITPLVLKDSISETGGPMQYIPTSVKVYAGYYRPESFALTRSATLVEGVDYTITYNSSYTDFTLSILKPSSFIAANGQPAAFQVVYDTTSPADGSMVGNTISVTNDDTALTTTTTNNRTSFYAERSSRISEGGSISLDTGYRLVLYKQDAETGATLAGAIFKVVTPSGREITLPATDANGRTYSEIFSSEEVAKGQFTVTEVQAPDGYQLLTDPVKVTIGSAGAIRIIKNTKISPATASLQITKSLTGRHLKEGEFSFELKDANNQVLQTKTNAENGQVTFDDLTFDKTGTYTYTISEVKGDLADITYSDKEITATVEVTQQDGKYVAAVTYSPDASIENQYVTTTTTTESTTTTTSTTATTTTEATTTSTTSATTESSTSSTSTSTAATSSSTTTASATATTEATTTSTTSATTESSTSSTSTSTAATSSSTTTASATATTESSTSSTSTSTAATSSSTTTIGNTTTATVDPSTGSNPSQTTSKKPFKKSGLPSTGEQAGLWLSIIGVVVIVAAAIYFYRTRR
ncbi:Spy0128 family protein [Streptococcus ferus]|uniref:Spy0128 family protein n=1 Tax=Streptococcus ferus TaxID=1345 RepID=UPI0035A068FE